MNFIEAVRDLVSRTHETGRLGIRPVSWAGINTAFHYNPAERCLANGNTSYRITSDPEDLLGDWELVRFSPGKGWPRKEADQTPCDTYAVGQTVYVTDRAFVKKTQTLYRTARVTHKSQDEGYYGLDEDLYFRHASEICAEADTARARGLESLGEILREAQTDAERAHGHARALAALYETLKESTPAPEPDGGV